MNHRVAVASTNGLEIDEHFGRSKSFYIFELWEDGNFELIEVRQNKSKICSEKHDADDLNFRINTLLDCNSVLCFQIGLSAEKALSLKEIHSFAIKGSVDRALDKLYQYYKHQNK